MAGRMEVAGHCDPRFAAVGERFRASFAAGQERGAAIALFVGGAPCVDLWGGAMDAGGERPWARDTLVNIWSTTKGVTAACFAIAVERGLCAYDDPVARFWPEFARGGKDAVSIAALLSHQAGLSAFARPVAAADFADAEALADLLAAQAPLWPPGSQAGYHAITIGFLASALFRRIEGRTLARFAAEEMAELDLHIGVGPDEDARVAEIAAAPGMAGDAVVPDLDALQAATLGNPALKPEIANEAAWRRAEIPSANGFATARGLAGLYASLIGGAPVASLAVSPAVLEQATRVRWAGEDAVLKIEARWAAGFLRNGHGLYGPSPAAFGHSGWGGSFAFADPDRQLAFAYVTNAMRPELVGDPRGLGLIEALYACL